MKFSDTTELVLKSKHQERVLSVTPDHSVYEAIEKMAEEGVNAVSDYAKKGVKPTGFVDTGAMLITDKPVKGMTSKDTTWGLQNCWGNKP